MQKNKAGTGATGAAGVVPGARTSAGRGAALQRGGALAPGARGKALAAAES